MATNDTDGLVTDKLSGKDHYQTQRTSMRLALESKDTWQTIEIDQPIHLDEFENEDRNKAIIDFLLDLEEVP